MNRSSISPQFWIYFNHFILVTLPHFYCCFLRPLRSYCFFSCQEQSLNSHLVLPKLFNCSVKSLFLENLSIFNICRNNGDFNLQPQKVDLRVWETMRQPAKIIQKSNVSISQLNSSKNSHSLNAFLKFSSVFSSWLQVVFYGIMKHKVKSNSNKLHAIMWSIMLLDFPSRASEVSSWLTNRPIES